VNVHAAKKAEAPAAGVAPDVAFGWELESGRPWVATARPVELQPFELRFTLVPVLEDDGTQRNACTKFEISGPPAQEGSEAFELTRAQVGYLADNFDRFRQMAENPGLYETIRPAMLRTPGERWTKERLALLVNEFRALEGDPDGRIYTLARMWTPPEQDLPMNLSTIHRALKKAEELGLLDPGERAHPRKRNI
jgi:hypothetical protein